MTDIGLRMLLVVTVGLALVLLLRRPARRAFGAGPAFTVWLLPVVLACAPLLPQEFAPAATWSLPALVVTPHSVAATQDPLIDWGRWMVSLWLLGASVGVLRLAGHYLRLCRGARRIPPEWSCWLADAMPGLDSRRMRVHAAGPAVLWALPRSWIVLPADFAARFGDVATRELVLRHELTHARRGDAWWSLAMELASALLWFHPLAWFARSRFRLDQELACDAASLRALPSRTGSYARALVDSVAVQPRSVLIPWLAEPQLKERLAMLTRIQPGSLRRRTGFLAVAVLVASGLLVAGGRTPAQAAMPASSASASTPPSVDVTFKNRNPPHYPIEGLHEGEQGNVLLDITVDASGKVTGVQIDQRGTDAAPVLQVAALKAAVGWKFNPGMANGRPVGGAIQVPVNFSLNEFHGDNLAPKPCPVGNVYEPGSSQCVKLPAGSSS